MKAGKWLRFLTLLLLGLWLFAADAAAAPNSLDVSAFNQGSVSLTKYLAVLEDASRSLTLAEVREPDLDRRFVGVQKPAEALSYGFTRSAYWLRLDLRNPSEQPVDRILEIGFPLLSSVELHQPGAHGTWRSLATGAAAAFSTRPYPNRFFVFPLTLPAQSDQVIYLRIRSGSSILIPARLWEPQAFHTYERNDYVTQAWYFGMAAALILFNLLLFVALRDVAYLLYVGFAISMALAISAANGFGKEFLWPDTTLWSDIAINVVYSLAYAAFLIFMRRMLNTRDVVPQLDRLIKLIIGILVLFPFGFVVSHQAFAGPTTLFHSATGVLILFVSMYCAIVKRQRIAVFFVAAFSMLLCAGLAVGLKAFNLLPNNGLTTNALQIGSALEMLLLAFALAYRFNMIRRQATADVQQANADLEQRLRSREAELTQSHQILRKSEHRQTLNQERQRMMEDMHDGVGASLTSALRVVEAGQLGEAEVAQVLKGCIDDLKLAIDAMEPVEADLLLLLATLRFRLGPRLETTGIALLWRVQDIPPLEWLDPKSSLHILRILQEAFTNIIKHTKATEITVATGADSSVISVTIADNGQGFSMGHALERAGKGLANQVRRAQAIGAVVKWDSNDSGTCLTLRLPIRRPNSRA